MCIEIERRDMEKKEYRSAQSAYIYVALERMTDDVDDDTARRGYEWRRGAFEWMFEYSSRRGAHVYVE